MNALPFAASRSRGITMVVWPVTELGGALPATRFYLAMASSIGLVAAYAAWISILGFGAAFAAALFGSTWLALLYGSEVMPNLWVGLLAVASVGVFGRFLNGQHANRSLLLASALLGLLGLFRPPDAIPVAVALVTVGALSKVSVSRIALLLAALVAGWIPWIVEMSYRLGGISDALDQGRIIAHVSTSSLGSRFIQNLAVLDGPTIGPVQYPRVSVAGIAWWAGLLIFAIGGLICAKGSRTYEPLLAATLAGLGLAAEYLVLVDGVAPRFLVPSYALLAVPAAWGLRFVFGKVRSNALGVVLIATLLAPWMVWQIDTANTVEAQLRASRAVLENLGGTVRDIAGNQPCSFASSDGYPQIEYASGCDGRRLEGDLPGVIQGLEQTILRGGRSFLVAQSLSLPVMSSAQLRLVQTQEGPHDARWYVQELSLARPEDGHRRAPE